MKDTNHPSRFGFVKRQLVQLSLLLAIATGLASILNPISAHADTAGTWTATGPMPSVRWGHAAIRLPNGQVLVAGGSDFFSHDGAFSTSAALYDPISNTWSATGSMATPRGGYTLTLLANGKVLAAGGANWSGTLATAELYDYTTGLWTATGSMPDVHIAHTATLLPSGKVLIAGGVNLLPGCCYFAWLGTAATYDPVSGTWSPTGSLAIPRQSSTATLLGNGKVLVAGGYSRGGVFDIAEIYDPAAGTWSFTSSMLGGPNSAPGDGILLPNGNVMVAGGYGPYPGTASVELYDSISGTWSFTGSMGVSRALHTATLMAGGKVLVAVGYAPVAGVISPTAEIYDSVLGTWSPTASMSTGRNSSTATLLSDGRVLVAGGVDDSGIVLASAEVYSAAPDVTPPVIACPAGISVPCSVDLLLPVAFSVTATDDSDPSPTVTSTPPSGSLFPIGQTTVNSTATDASGNHSYCTFTVTRAPLGFAGFLSPIGGADTTGGSFASPVRTFKMGSMISVKFTASCGGSAVLTGVHRLQAVKYNDSTSAGTPIDATAQGTATTGNRFRFADGQWQFNLATKATGMSTGIWLLRAMLSDGSQHSAWIQIK